MHSSHRDTLDALVREIYVLGAVNREVQRRAVPEHAPAGLQALAVLARTDASRVSEVADRLRIDLSVASRQISALESAGWVAREPDPDDRRAQRLRVTDAGQTVLEDTRSRMVDAYSHVLEGWSEQDVLALTTALERLREDFVRAAAPALAEASR
jgi:DNA-binding MarR family transcriptional regulator